PAHRSSLSLHDALPISVATDSVDKTELRLMSDSKAQQAIVVLADTPYYEALERAMKIRKYVKQRKVNQLAKSVQDIIRNQQDERSEEHTSELQSRLELV